MVKKGSVINFLNFMQQRSFEVDIRITKLLQGNAKVRPRDKFYAQLDENLINAQVDYEVVILKIYKSAVSLLELD